jgi:hypothetical protein
MSEIEKNNQIVATVSRQLYDPINKKEWLDALDQGYEMALREVKGKRP